MSEVQLNSDPDIVFKLPTLPNTPWILSVKIGETPRILTEAFIQFQRHKQEHGSDFGVILFLPENARDVPPEESAIDQFLARSHVFALVDTPWIKEEVRQYPFESFIIWLATQASPRIQAGQRTAYSLETTITLLREHVVRLMGSLEIDQQDLLTLITNDKLFSHFASQEGVPREAAQFLAAYVFLSQVLFLRLFASAHPEVAPAKGSTITRTALRLSFQQILKIDYKAIYELDVLDHIPDAFLRETYALLTGLALERVRADIAGRLFHDLMPAEVRKMLAAFYTRPQAAEILATLAIQDPYATVWDPACGSGTILVAAYKRKQELHYKANSTLSPHRKFVEQDIAGADIMPFAVHLTSANLASLDPATTVERIQISQLDSLSLVGRTTVRTGVQLALLNQQTPAIREGGASYTVDIGQRDVTLMNPPFTKTERGIANLVNMSTFREDVGATVGLWGHFLALADRLLVRDSGTLGAVVPINLLHGTESEKVRDLLFRMWTPLYVLKPTKNYAFSESSEYRDIIVVCRKAKPKSTDRVRFALIKKDMTTVTVEEAKYLATLVMTQDHLRSSDIDVESFTMREVHDGIGNLMRFCGVSDFAHRDAVREFLAKFDERFGYLPDAWLSKGIYFSSGGLGAVLFARVRRTARSGEAELFFNVDEPRKPLTVRTIAGLAGQKTSGTDTGSSFEIERSALLPAIRSYAGLTKLDITDDCDYVAIRPYAEQARVERAIGTNVPTSIWTRHTSDIERVKTHLCVTRRVNPYSPSNSLIAFVSRKKFVPTNQFHAVKAETLDEAKALAVLFNSIIFLADWLTAREETGGRYVDISIDDLKRFRIRPDPERIKSLVGIYEQFKDTEFPALTRQLDRNFDDHYEAFWSQARKSQPTLMGGLPFEADEIRMEYDRLVCEALSVSEPQLSRIYAVLAREMI